MSSIENNPWQGPFESLEAFEAFQDQSIAGLADFALNSPRHISDTEVLKDQLWITPETMLVLYRSNSFRHVLDLCNIRVR